MCVLSMLVHSEKLSKLWELDVLGIRNPSGRKSNEEAKTAVQAYFLYKVKMNDDRRYEVRLPWIEGHPPVPRYFYLAKKRVENVLRKLEEKNFRAACYQVFRDWLEVGIIEEIPASKWVEGQYLPHSPVVKESGTTGVRTVFDASARERGQPSLNQCL